MKLALHPSVGVGRLGNSPQSFYLSPTTIGGLPWDSDQYGNQLGPVSQFKDETGQVKRQGQPFKIFQEDGTELTLESPNVASIEWTVHLANKKAAWYQYSELEGNLLYGPDNSYENRGVEFRNASSTDRRSLIVDPGPRTISGAQQQLVIDKNTVPEGYPATFPPDEVEYGVPVTTLGELMTDNQGRLVVLGGFGHAGGSEPLTSYGGSDTWHDDIADGPVYCEVTFNDGTPSQTLQAWIIIGSPDFAPEIVNISTLSDTMLDVGVRAFNLIPELYTDGVFQSDYRVNYQRDILPIIERFKGYQWVANVQSMSAFASNDFDYSDNSDENRGNREQYFSYFREPNDKSNPTPDQSQQYLFQENAQSGLFPMMPLNSGSNSVSNTNIVKFLALNDTQHFMLSQWAKGMFDDNENYTPYPIAQSDQASVGNCVGLPMCPGIEVTWSLQNPAIYESSYVIKDQKGKDGYNATGLDPSRDECEGGGCQPGDLTKRMACPWQADFFQCTVQYINFTNPSVNKVDGAPLPPTYYSYWWPPQSPWDVLTGELSAEGQKAGNLPAGQQMNYARGINNFVQMVEYWWSLAFIRNVNTGNAKYPYFTETERNTEIFGFKEVGVGAISGNPDDNETTIPVFYVEGDTSSMKAKSAKGAALASVLEKKAFKKISVASGGLGAPRSGTRMRR
ncbi:CTQ-dependent lysine 6-oxidase LodA [Marinomonas ostreistagni]|uniref:CTQ-dependent lysine 6-oxidase LodA n=1 Tax=Marinomonas ostreistagni TaxID=359209 RepID=A0ABS0Z5Y6_9GAMM|nr:CTQ-dependent lysine 6-oxidase LodA [Marinomonas ostreistagni]MBJ7549079.1 CTQ-dependent lysine 6-oxidase LodA [Marinomonas ostreistagni]